MVKNIEFLDFVIENWKILMDPMKIKGITDWPVQTIDKQVWSFLGFCNFCFWFIHKYADISHLLNDLLKKTQPWEWMKECQEAFEFLKKKFTEFPVLVIPDQLKLMLLNLPQALYSLKTT